MRPGNALVEVKRLAADEGRCSFFEPVLAELRRHSLDSEDLREIIGSELGEVHCFKSTETQKYHPGTVSDYYSIWIDVCASRMFVKLLVSRLNGSEARLVITSFKKDARYEF